MCEHRECVKVQYAFIVAKMIYPVFVCRTVALMGGCWKTYDSEMQRNMGMLICFVVTGILGTIIIFSNNDTEFYMVRCTCI